MSDKTLIIYDCTSTRVPVTAKNICKKIKKKTDLRMVDIWVEALIDYAKKKKVKV